MEIARGLHSGISADEVIGAKDTFKRIPGLSKVSPQQI